MEMLPISLLRKIRNTISIGSIIIIQPVIFMGMVESELIVEKLNRYNPYAIVG